MLHRLTRNEHERVRPFFVELNYQLITTAVLCGASAGTVWVDHPSQPKAAFLDSPEGCFLAGDADNSAFNHAVNGLILDEILIRVNAIALICHPDTWESRLDNVLAGCRHSKRPRMHYLFNHRQVDRRANVPDGFAIERIDGTLLSRPGLIVPGHATAWMRNNWESVDGFLQNGFGFCTVHSNRLVSWSLSDCVVGDACEIGIHTDPDYRRRGLATLTAAATVDHALSQGLTTIGWQCHTGNYGSRGVAEKVGFVKERDYVHYFCTADDEPMTWLGA